MANKYRLSSNAYDRETPDEQITPKKIYFISVEGVATEVEYLQGLSDYREDLGIESLVNVEILRRKTKDGYSAPDQVVELTFFRIYRMKLRMTLSQILFASILKHLDQSVPKKEMNLNLL